MRGDDGQARSGGRDRRCRRPARRRRRAGAAGTRRTDHRRGAAATRCCACGSSAGRTPGARWCSSRSTDSTRTPTTGPRDRFYRDALGALFLTQVSGDRHAPRCLGVDAELGLILMDDLGTVDSLVQPLLEGSADQARTALLAYVRRLGAMHADTAGRQREYDEIADSLQAPPKFRTTQSKRDDDLQLLAGPGGTQPAAGRPEDAPDGAGGHRRDRAGRSDRARTRRLRRPGPPRLLPRQHGLRHRPAAADRLRVHPVRPRADRRAVSADSRSPPAGAATSSPTGSPTS